MTRWFIVEEDPVTRGMYEHALAHLPGVDAEIFGGGIEMLKRLDAGDIPDVLLLDVGVADLPGPEVVAEVREAPATGVLPIVALSSDAWSPRVDHAYRNGANASFLKPSSDAGALQLFAHLSDHWSRALSPTRGSALSA